MSYFFLLAIGPDGLCCQSREFKEWHGCRSTKGVTKGLSVGFEQPWAGVFGNKYSKLIFITLLFFIHTQGSTTMRYPVMTKVCVELVGPQARLPWTWVCSLTVLCSRTYKSTEHYLVTCSYFLSRN